MIRERLAWTGRVTDNAGFMPANDHQRRLERRMIDTLVVLAAIGWVAWVWLTVAGQLRSGAPLSPPLFASANLFAMGVLLLLGIGASPLHLLWWFPLSAALGVLLLALPVWVQFNMSCLSVLAGWVRRRDPPNAP